jgi:hypothetical protein
MKLPIRSSFIAAVLLAIFGGAAMGQATTAAFTPPENLDYRKANVMSEGVRLNAELFSLKSLAGKPLPTIIMAHGWGGTAAGFRRDAVELAAAGYLVIVFDYRGWGESDSRVILTGPAPVKPAQYRKGQKFTAEVTEVREVVDPFEQTTDWFNLINWAMGEPAVDKNRLGLRGSSYSGGHVLYVAAYEPRVKAFVSQVGAFDSRPKSISLAGAAGDQVKTAHDEATKRARGEIGYPEAGQRVIGNLYGAPIRDKLLRWAPVEVADKRTDCAMLFIVAEKEELFDNRDHAKAAYDRARGPKKYVEIPKITHYGIYRESREEAVKLAVEWFDQYLKK